MPKWTNTFNLGLHSDFDAAEQPQDTYRESLNGKVFFDANGSLAWQPTLGNTQIIDIQGEYGAAFAIAGIYQPIGFTEFPDKIVIQSVSQNGVNSEIGLAWINTSGNGLIISHYQTIFNDKFDPNGDLLKFNLAHDMTSNIANVENEKIQRVYFSDNFNEGRTFNVVLGLTKNSPEFINGDYKPLLSTGLYPEFYSVQSMSDAPDMRIGAIKFLSHTSGNLLSGVYQYCYRLVTRDGYKTPFITPTRPFFVTPDPIGALGPSGQPDSQEYAMQASQLATSKGLTLEINDIDLRYDKIEICYIYSITPTSSIEASVFATINVPTATNYVFVNHIDNRGTPIS